MASQAQSVREIVQRWAEHAPERTCLSFYERGEVCERLTYGDLAQRASAHARHFRKHGLREGDAVVLLAHSVPGFVAAFLGAQEAGLLAVPCPPPEPLENARRVGQRVTEILSRCRARALLDPGPAPADAELASVLAQAGIAVLASPEPGAIDPAEAGTENSDRFPLAYCQFTSGSGGRAKGVLLTHEGVAANIRAMAEAYRMSSDDVMVTWLPLFHDMGLVAYILMPLVLGCVAHVMSPLSFIARPASWLSLISRVRGTMAAGPNFAYALCARKVSDAERAELDLSSWRVACNGSEPVTKSAVDAFVHRFAPRGFRPETMLPCYGLAENTLCATSSRPGEGTRFEEVSRGGLEQEGVARPESPGSIVACLGRPLPGHQIVVLDGGGRPIADRQIGEIAIRGESLMHGYLPGTEGDVTLTPDGWLLTGDLGYVADGDLFLVGRKKDLIICAGRNYSPVDLEEAAASIHGVRPGRAVAFSVPGEESERVVIAVERRENWAGDSGALKVAIRNAVFAAIQLSPHEILLLPHGTLPLTSSGKVMRPEARRLYLLGQWAAG